MQADNLALLAMHEGHIAPAASLAVSHDEAIAATGGNDAIVTLWDIASMAPVKTLYAVDAPVTRVSISADCRFVAMTGGGTGTAGAAMVDIGVLNPSDMHAHSIVHRCAPRRLPSACDPAAGNVWHPTMRQNPSQCAHAAPRHDRPVI
jgi:hypothetical protein